MDAPSNSVALASSFKKLTTVLAKSSLDSLSDGKSRSCRDISEANKLFVSEAGTDVLAGLNPTETKTLAEFYGAAFDEALERVKMLPHFLMNSELAFNGILLMILVSKSALLIAAV